MPGSSGPSDRDPVSRNSLREIGGFFFAHFSHNDAVAAERLGDTERQHGRIMNIVTPAEMTEIDRLTIEKFGLNSLVLMENAARSVLPHLPEGSVGILVGPGNNGGDGLVLGRALAEAGRDVEILLLSEKLSKDSQIQRALAEAWNVPVHHFSEKNLEMICERSDVLVDAIFGTGLDRELKDHWRSTVEFVNQRAIHRLAIDIPSGVNGLNGQIMGAAIEAHTTVTFGCLKPAHLLHPGKERCGDLHLTQPGFHPQALAQYDKVQLFTQRWAERYLPKLWATAHKGDNGRLLLVTGSLKYPGAGILSVIGALKGGAGLVTHSTELELISSLLASCPEAMPLCRPEAPDLNKFHAVVVGCGLGDQAKTIGLEILRNSKLPTVVDADCLEHIAEVPKDERQHFVVTPHPGELARMRATTVEALEKNRIQSALDSAEELGCVVCFKGSPTIVASPDGRAYLNCTGNPILAQGGSGDLLAGIIGAFLAYGLPPLEAAACAVYIHGLAADLAAEKFGSRGVPASQIAELVPIAYEESVGNPSPFPVF